MCTVSWQYQDPDTSCIVGYDLFFNRDELLSREIAEPPAVRTANGARAIAPIDRNAQGTWLAVNECGVTTFLLNHFPHRAAKTMRFMQSKRSRGSIVLGLMSLATKQEFASALATLPLAEYLPFRLGVAFPNAIVMTWLWDGQTLTDEGHATGFFTSSSYRSPEIVAQRLKVIAHSKPQSLQEFADLHRSHNPQKSAHSICMHRDDAQTVSFSHIAVREDKISFAYANGAPCCTAADHKVELLPLKRRVIGQVA